MKLGTASYWPDHLPDHQRLLYGYGAITVLSLLAAIVTQQYFLALAPGALLLVFLYVVDFRLIFYLLFFCIPLSTEVYLPGGLGTDLPTEPLTVGLMFAYGLYVLRHGVARDRGFWRHPLTILLLAHVAWIGITAITSAHHLVSVKFLLAKVWYVTVFYFLAGHLIRQPEQFERLRWVILIPLAATVFITMVRHSAYGFSFSEVHQVLHPYQRNHVNYAADMALFLPWLVVGLWSFKRYTRGWYIFVGMVVLFLLGVALAYTRAAYISLLMAVAAYWVIRWRLMRPVLLAGLVVVLLGVGYMVHRNQYLELAPNFDRTISHENFDNLLGATAKGEDISTMERLYRWVAGARMSNERLIFGWGPGNFINFYKPYTVRGFRTYVSANEDQSGIHNYYLMTLVDQGVPGLLLLLALVGYTLIRGEQLYHQLRDPRRKRIVLIALLTTIIIDAFQLINDLIETDKVGSFFFLCLALIVRMEVEARKEWSVADK